VAEENARTVLDNCRKELQTMFGYLAENNAVGITGALDDLSPSTCEVYTRSHDRNGRIRRARGPDSCVRAERPLLARHKYGMKDALLELLRSSQSS
jgi:hypothetical protein